MNEQRKSRQSTLVFHFLPFLPKQDATYWCVIKAVDTEGNISYHYHYVEFLAGAFGLPVQKEGGPVITVEAWCLLPDPKGLFEEIVRPEPKKIIVPRSKFIPGKN